MRERRSSAAATPFLRGARAARGTSECGETRVGDVGCWISISRQNELSRACLLPRGRRRRERPDRGNHRDFSKAKGDRGTLIRPCGAPSPARGEGNPALARRQPISLPLSITMDDGKRTGAESSDGMRDRRRSVTETPRRPIGEGGRRRVQGTRGEAGTRRTGGAVNSTHTRRAVRSGSPTSPGLRSVRPKARRERPGCPSRRPRSKVRERAFQGQGRAGRDRPTPRRPTTRPGRRIRGWASGRPCAPCNRPAPRSAQSWRGLRAREALRSQTMPIASGSPFASSPDYRLCGWI